MSTILYLFIMQIGTISTLLTMSGLAFFGYHGLQYAKTWWVTPSDEPVSCDFWQKRRKQSIVMGIVLLIGISLPTRSEAIAQYFGYKAAHASIWDRLFPNRETIEDTAKKLANQVAEER